MKGKKYLGVILISVLMVSNFVSCKSETSDKAVENPTEEADTSVKSSIYSGEPIETIGISMPALALERWETDANLLKDSFEASGYDVQVSYGNNLIDTQINDINKMIDNGVDLLVIAPVDSDSLGKVMERADQEGIPVVAYDRLIFHAPNLLAYVSYDNYQVGQLQAQFIVDSLDVDNSSAKDSFNIEIFSGDPADNNALFFYQGAMDILEPYIDSGKIVVPSNQVDFYSCSNSSWSTAFAEERMEILLASYYSNDTQLDAVLSPNDSLAIGITNAISDSYKKENSVIVTGQDCDSANIQNIKNGLQSMSIYKDFGNEALATIYIVESYIKGTSTDQDLTAGSTFNFNIKRDTSSYVSDGFTITSYLLAPKVITMDNIDELEAN